LTCPDDLVSQPAQLNGRLAERDEIVRVDGMVCSTPTEIRRLLVGNDTPGVNLCASGVPSCTFCVSVFNTLLPFEYLR
jgi:hypothetical protein